jgi:hypothetical protein
VQIHKDTSSYLLNYTDLKYLGSTAADAAAVVFIFPATVYTTIIAHP